MFLLIASLQAFASDQANCVIPVYVKTYDVNPNFYHAYSKGVYDAAEVWNAAGTGFTFDIIEWNSASDKNDNAITISVGPVSGDLAGITWARETASGMINRARIILDSDTNFCLTTEQTDCYNVSTTTIHEMGHAIGLSHEPSDRSVMYMGIFQDTVVDQIPVLDVERARQISERYGCQTTNGHLTWGKKLIPVD